MPRSALYTALTIAVFGAAVVSAYEVKAAPVVAARAAPTVSRPAPTVSRPAPAAPRPTPVRRVSDLDGQPASAPINLLNPAHPAGLLAPDACTEEDRRQRRQDC